jgi:cytochrome c peroxidase
MSAHHLNLWWKTSRVRFSRHRAEFRGLTARAPYFANGSARDLIELVNFFDRRFKIGLTDKEKQDLVNFLSIL